MLYNLKSGDDAAAILRQALLKAESLANDQVSLISAMKMGKVTRWESSDKLTAAMTEIGSIVRSALNQCEDPRSTPCIAIDNADGKDDDLLHAITIAMIENHALRGKLELRGMRPRVSAAAEPFVRYWRIYGGWRAFVTSPYLIAAAVLTGVCYPFWSKPGTASADLAVTVIPSIMAFSLGGMAIFLAFSGGRFLNVIRQNGGEKSLFMTVITNFFHFLTVQTLALISAIIVLAFPLDKIPSGIAFFFLAYSVTTAVASAAALFNVSRVYNLVGDDDDPS